MPEQSDFTFMRIVLTLLLLSSVCSLDGQERDRRKSLEHKYRTSQLAVSPAETIWMVTDECESYFVKKADFVWRKGPRLCEEREWYDIHLDKVSFFDADTAIITGSINVDSVNPSSNGLFRTTDAGANWSYIISDGNYNLNCAAIGPKGMAWSTSHSGAILHTTDYGRSWRRLKVMNDSAMQVGTIFMVDSARGASCSYGNRLYFTNDNWSTSTDIETPLDQHPNHAEHYCHTRISRIAFWDEYIIVKQNCRLYYSDTSVVDWHAFPTELLMFEIDTSTNTLVAITDSLSLVRFTSPVHCVPILKQKLDVNPSYLTIVNGAIYIESSDDAMIVIEDSTSRLLRPFTTDEQIETPNIVAHGELLLWGSTKNHVYVSEDKGQSWFRERILDFAVQNIALLNDSVVVLWDGMQGHYLYALDKHMLSPFQIEDSIAEFLSSPITRIAIKSTSKGCFHNQENELIYEKLSDSVMGSFQLTKGDKGDYESSQYTNIVHTKILRNILDNINSNPYVMPSYSDFEVTEKDVRRYLESSDFISAKLVRDFVGGAKEELLVFFHALPTLLDTVSDLSIRSILTEVQECSSTNLDRFSISIENENSDTLHMEHSTECYPRLWQLPWIVSYKSHRFKCYSLDFSKYINSCIPAGFIGKELFDNRHVIQLIGEYMWLNRESK